METAENAIKKEKIKKESIPGLIDEQSRLLTEIKGNILSFNVLCYGLAEMEGTHHLAIENWRQLNQCLVDLNKTVLQGKKDLEKTKNALRLSERNVIQGKKNKITKNHFSTQEIISRLVKMGFAPWQFEKLEKSELENVFQTLTGTTSTSKIEAVHETKIASKTPVTEETQEARKDEVAAKSQATSETQTSDKFIVKEITFKEFLTAAELDRQQEIKEELAVQGEGDLNGRSNANP